MANISVVELLNDPDFVDPCTVLRNVETVGSDGIVSYELQTFQIFASIQAMGGDDLMVTPDLARTGGSYEVITTFPLATATDTSKADTVLWRGIEFVVTSVSNFLNFDDQYEGVMEIKTLSPPAGAP